MSDTELPVQWLRHVIEGDKAAAERISARVWIATESLGDWSVNDPDGDAVASFTHAYSEGPTPLDEYDARHIALHDPRDVISDCEAKLAILDEHPPEGEHLPYEDETPACGRCGDYGITEWPCRTIELLASAYRHRDGYKERWGSNG